MRRSLHMKLVLIMVLLIVSLMVVVGAFLMNSVTGYYINDFYSQMSTAFGEENVEFVRDLRTAAEGEEDGGAMIGEVLSAYVGVLGVDGRIRNYYVLDGTTGQYLTGSADAPQGGIAITPNISAALLGNVGFESDVTADYMDAAIPITRGGTPYVVYILDNREAAQNLNSEMFTLILEALVLGLAAGFMPTTADAASSSELKAQLNNLKKQKSAIEAEIKNLKNQIKENGTEIEYTVIYLGDEDITEDIFGLTEEQTELAADLADSLKLYMEEGEDDGTTD